MQPNTACGIGKHKKSIVHRLIRNDGFFCHHLIKNQGIPRSFMKDMVFEIKTQWLRYFSFATATPIYRGQDVIISGQNGAYRGFWEKALLPKYYE
jgi:hypothetical protein